MEDNLGISVKNVKHIPFDLPTLPVMISPTDQSTHMQKGVWTMLAAETLSRITTDWE